MKRLNHKRWTLIYLLSILLSLMFAPHSHSQSIDCQHDDTSIEYYDNMRTLPGAVTDLQGTEITFQSRDKYVVVTRTFHLTDSTRFFIEKQMQATPVNRTYFDKHHDGFWVARYCAHCRAVFLLIKVEA